MRKANVFDDIFPPEKAAVMTIKATLHSEIIRCAKNYAQSDLSHILGVSQPRVSDLMRGKIANFNLEALVEYADKLKMQPEIKTRKPLATMLASA